MPDNEKHKHQNYIKQYLNTYKGSIIDKGRQVIGQRKNGETFPMDLFVSMVMHNNEPLFIGVIRDASEQNKSQNQKHETLHEALKELVLQQISITLQQRSGSIITNHSELKEPVNAHTDNIYRLLTRHYFIDNKNPRAKIQIGKKLKEMINPLALALYPVPVNYSAEERRSTLTIECDETLLDVCFYLLANNLAGIGLQYLTVNIFEEKSMAQIVIEAGIQTSLSIEQMTGKLFSINGHTERNSKSISSLLALHNGKILLDKIASHQLTIHMEFPQTVAH